MDVDIETKQDYLRAEIIEKGYEADDFMRYIVELKGENGFDWELWTFTEWQNIVKTYQESMNVQIVNEKNSCDESPEYTNRLEELEINWEKNNGVELLSNIRFSQKESDETNSNENVKEIKEVQEENEGKYLKGELEGMASQNKQNEVINKPKQKNEGIIKKKVSISAMFKLESEANKTDKDTNSNLKINQQVVDDIPKDSNSSNNNTKNSKLDNKWEQNETLSSNSQHLDNANKPKDTERKSILPLNAATAVMEANKVADKNNNQKKLPEYISKPQDYDSTEIIQCTKWIKTELTDWKDLQVVISKPELIKHGFFSFSYYQFTLSSPQLKTTTTRKSTDFYWWKDKLTLSEPSLFIAPLPSSSLFKSKNHQDIDYWVFYLQLFIDSLTKSQQIRSSKLFHDFITLSLPEFEAVSLKCNKIPQIESISSIVSKTGILELKINRSIEEKARGIQEDIHNKSLWYDKLNTSLKDLINEMTIMSTKFKEVSSCFTNWKLAYEKTKLDSTEGLDSGFNSLANLFNSWSNGYKNQIEFFNPNIRILFKYMNKEIQEYEIVLDEFKSAKNTYREYKGKNKVKRREWECIRNYYGWYMNKAVDKYEKLQRFQSKRMKKHFENVEMDKSRYIEDYAHFIRLVTFNFKI